MKFIKLFTTAATIVSLFGPGTGKALADSLNGNGQGQANGLGLGWGNTSASGTTTTASSIQGTTSDSLNLMGRVGAGCTIAISATAKATSLDLKAGETDALVGVVTETCNSKRGYTVSITSQNGGQLRSGDASAPLANYSASYDDATGVIATGLTATRSKVVFNRSGDLRITVPAHPQAIAGSYADNLTVVIAAR